MEKSIYLNQATPLYSTFRTHRCIGENSAFLGKDRQIEFKTRIRNREETERRTAIHNKKIASITAQRIAWITGAWTASVDRMTDKLLPTFKITVPCF